MENKTNFEKLTSSLNGNFSKIKISVGHGNFSKFNFYLNVELANARIKKKEKEIYFYNDSGKIILLLSSGYIKNIDYKKLNCFESYLVRYSGCDYKIDIFQN